MEIIVAVIVGLFAGLIAFLLFGLFPFTAPYASLLALIIVALAFWTSYSRGRWFNPRP